MALSDSETQPISHTNSGDTASCTDAWRKKNILSLDGGGIRGYWTLLVLEKLMEAIAKEEEKFPDNAHPYRKDSFCPDDFPRCFAQRGGRPIDYRELSATQKYLPCHYFDFICGTSTGGLIAIMLGRLRMSVDDCLQEYENLGHRIFGKPRLISQRNIGVVPWSKYDAEAMEHVFKDVTRRRCEKSAWGNNIYNEPKFTTRPFTCSVFLTSMRRTKSAVGIDTEDLYILRSYDHYENSSGGNTDGRFRYNYGPAQNMKLWEIARAATAAPMYFDEFKIRIPNGNPIYFSDGGFGVTNNPTQVGIEEVGTLIGRDRIGIITSIGTARAKNKPEARGLFKRIKKMAAVATDPDIVANWLQYQNLPRYWRFNDEQGIDIDLDEWKPNGWTTRNPGRETLETIKNGFNKWVTKHENWENIDRCARELVANRQERILDRSRWHRFSLAAFEYRCQNRDCHDVVYETLSSFYAHWGSTHSGKANADELKEPSYKCWEYSEHH